MAILCYQGEELELLAERKKKTKRERLGPSAMESLLKAPFALSLLSQGGKWPRWGFL